MKSKHRGYTIEVKRERCLGGWSMLYTTIIRDSDGWLATELAEDCDDTVRDQIGYMKERIDAELACEDPWLEKEGWGPMLALMRPYDTSFDHYRTQEEIDQRDGMRA